MTKIQTNERQFVGIVFFMSVMIRTVLGWYYPRTVNCYPDEALYLSAAESLWNHHQVMAFHIPISFGKIGYSLLIAPAFAFSNVYMRTMAIAVINAVVMSLGVFPIYALAKRLLKEEKYRRWSVLFYALSATMTYTMTYVSEVVFVPVMVWLIYLLYGLLTGLWQGKKKIYRSILAVIVWFVAYLTKEIALVIPAALALYLVTEGMRGAVQRKRQSIQNASIEQNVEKKKTGKYILVLVAMAVACVGIYFLSNYGTQYYQLGFDFSLLQERFGYLVYGCIFFIICTLMAFLFLPVLYPLIYGRCMEEHARKLCRFLWYVLFITAFIVSYTIYIYEDYPSATPRAHVRYVEYLFVPFLMLLFHLIEQKRPQFSWNQVGILGGILGICLIVFTGFYGQTIDHTMLFYVQLFSQDGHVFLPYKARICMLLLIVIVAFFTYLFYNKNKFFITLLLSGILIASLGNNILSTYVQYKTHTHTKEETAEAEQVLDFVRTHADVNIGVLEPKTHDELLDTLLIDCHNVRNVGIVDGWYFVITGGDMKKGGLASEGEVAKNVAYEAPQTLQYIFVRDDAYTIEEPEAMTAIETYPAIGYTLYELKDEGHLPVMLWATP